MLLFSAACKNLWPPALCTHLAVFAGVGWEPERISLQSRHRVSPACHRYHHVQYACCKCTCPCDCHDTHGVLFCYDRDIVRCIPHRECWRGYVDAQHVQAAAYFYLRCFRPDITMPKICQDIALISPLTYGNDMIEYAYTGKSLFSSLLDIVVLVMFIIIFQVTANRLYKKFNEWLRAYPINRRTPELEPIREVKLGIL